MSANSPEGRDATYAPEDEIDLADLVAVLVRRRWLVIGLTLGLFLVALGYSLVVPAQYEVSGYLSVGKIGDTYIEEPEQVTVTLQSLAEVRVKRMHRGGDRLGFSVGEGLALATEGGGMVRMALPQVPKGKGAAAFLGELAGQLVSDHRTRFEQAKARAERKVASLETKLADLRARESRLQKQLSAVKGGEGESRSVTVLQSILSDIRQQTAEVGRSLEEAQAELEAIRPTRVLLEPGYSQAPVAPNTRLNAALGLVLGLFLSVFLAFLVEFWVNNRARILAEAGERPND